MMDPVRRLPTANPQPDPVLAALIDRLPASGSVWPVKKRAAWMQMVWMAFELAYDADAGDVLELPPFLQTAAAPPAPAKETVMPSTPATKTAPYAFLIDKEGYARRGDGTRILPQQVGGIMYDQRGEGDLGTIIWADDTTGIMPGLQLDISPAF